MSTKGKTENEECCGNCFWFNGEAGDGIQFCDKWEMYVYEHAKCFYYVTDPKKRRTQQNESNKFQSIHLRPAERQIRREQEKEKEDKAWKIENSIYGRKDIL